VIKFSRCINHIPTQIGEAKHGESLINFGARGGR
jgi:hypothetical protein